MQLGITQFDLGKKAFSFPINEELNGVLFGICDRTDDAVKLTLAYHQIRSGTNERVGDVHTIDAYEVRSAKFRSGDFDETEARRYLKSRFREVIREINSQGDDNGSGKNQFIIGKSEEFQRQSLSVNDVTNSDASDETETASVEALEEVQ